MDLLSGRAWLRAKASVFPAARNPIFSMTRFGILSARRFRMSAIYMAWSWQSIISGKNHMPVIARLLSIGIMVALAGMAEAITISSNTTINAANKAAYQNQDIEVTNGATLTLEGAHVFSSLLLTGNSVLTHADAASASASTMAISVTGNVQIDAGSAIDVSGRGVVDSGSASGTVGSYSGGSHGGLGGVYGVGYATNGVFGSLTQPVTFGVGGQDSSDGVRGGGVVRLVVTGTLTVDGAIRANGDSSGASSGDGGGSGGSVWIDATTLVGSGTIEAKGGNGGTTGTLSGAGGGGRIAVYYTNPTTFNFSTQAMAEAGSSVSTSSGSDGGAGTIYAKLAGNATGDLWLNNANRDYWRATPLTGMEAETAIVHVDGRADAYFIGPVTTAGLVVSGTGLADVHGVLTTGDVETVSGGVIRHLDATTAASSYVEIHAANVKVNAGSSIDVSGRGVVDSGSTSGAVGSYSGASHGGRGGIYGSGYATNETFGSLTQPVTFGVGGQDSSDGVRGGGVVRLVVTGTLTVDGAIRANGDSSGASSGDGGGSGGSVWIDATTIVGGGTIEAKGGNGGTTGTLSGAGGGGRIAIYYTNPTTFNFSTQAMAEAGSSVSTSSGSDGGAGTIYVKEAGSALANVLLDNAGRDRYRATLISGNLSGVHLQVAGRAVALITNGSTLQSAAVQADAFANFESNTVVLQTLSATGNNSWIYVQGPLTVNHLQLASGAGLKQSYDAGSAIDTVVAHIQAVDIEIDSTSVIDVSGQGVIGSDSTSGVVGSYSGGSHGGLGGVYGVGYATNGVFGSLTQPVTFGVGGQDSSDGVRGGGVVRLVVTGTLTVDGAIRANGDSSGASSGDGGGSGGSVWIDATTLVGSGTIEAKGGNGGTTGTLSGAGGGGRIAVYYTNPTAFDFSSKVQAESGLSSSAATGSDGSAGTIYVKRADSAVADLWVRNAGRDKWVPMPLTGDEALTAVVRVKDAGAVNFTGPANTEGLVVAGNGFAYVHGVLTTGDVITETGGTILHGYAASSTSPYAEIHADNITVNTGSTINVSGRGVVDSGSTSGAIGAYSGGSHGGLGGIYTGYSTNAVFGSATQPVAFGVGGYDSSDAVRGGGVVHLVVTGTLTVDGTISANGSSAGASSGDGGGAGGSIWIDTHTLAGTGSIEARGGNGGTTGTLSGAGGGGRIAIYHQALDGFNISGPSTQLNVAAGARTGSSATLAGVGTIHTYNTEVPPRVMSTVPVSAAPAPGPVTNSTAPQVDLYFSQKIDASTLTTDDVVVTGPDPSGVVTVTGITALTPYNYRLALALPLSEGQLSEGQWSVEVGPTVVSLAGKSMDQDQDAIEGEPTDDRYVGYFNVDTTAPVAPTVTSHATAPSVNVIATKNITLAGTRNESSAIRINGVEKAVQGTGAWTTPYTLVEGANTLNVVSRDPAGNDSVPVQVLFTVDTIKPVVSGFSPSVDTNIVPLEFSVGVSESGSGINDATISYTVTRNASPVAGSAAYDPVASRIVFTPAAPFVEGNYVAQVSVADNAGNVSTTASASFSLDVTPPGTPVVTTPPPEATSINQVVLNGTRDTYTAILLNGVQVVASGASADWSYILPLTMGANHLVFTARDSAGNVSLPLEFDVYYDNLAPGPVSFTIDPNVDGMSLKLSWAGYDHVANGNDIKEYRIYTAAAPITDVAGLTAAKTVSHPTKATTLTGLARDTAVHVAIMAVDTANNLNTTVVSQSATPVDVTPPGEVSALTLVTGETTADFSWTAPTASDLAGYRVYINGVLSSGAPQIPATSYQLTGLQPATSYSVRITTFDQSLNESSGTTKQAVTWLNNPSLSATPYSGRVDLAWSYSDSLALVKEFRIYQSTSPFTSVSGMTAKSVLAKTKTTASMTGLTNNTTYYFAITAVPVSGSQRPDVTAVSALPVPDTLGPVLGDVKLGATTLIEGSAVNTGGTLSVTATDVSGITRVEFLLDDVLVGTDSSATGGYTATLDLLAISDGSHVLKVRAIDTVNNVSEVTRTLSISHLPPPAPAITSPANNLVTRFTEVTVKGTGQVNGAVAFVVNGQPAAATGTVGADGRFSILLALAEGANAIQAKVTDAWGESPLSAAVTVNVDTSVPAEPTNLAAVAQPAGKVRLSWTPSIDQDTAGYDIYRHNASFEQVGTATKLNATLFKGTTYDDMPATDGTWFYRVVAVNALGTASVPSNEASAGSDSVAPRAVSIVYSPQGLVDAVTGRTGQGRVDVALTVSEALQVAPYLAVVPPNGAPLTVELSRVDDTHYTGFFVIDGSAGTGNAYALFSARDPVGNRGTVIETGSTFGVDTTGPELVAIVLDPSAPVRYDTAPPIAVSFTLSKAMKPAATPEITWLLSGAGRTTQLLAGLSSSDGVIWTAMLLLPSDAGALAPENLLFTYRGVDALENVSTRITAANGFQVYQGALPAADAPYGLTAKALPGGQVRLAWLGTPEASTYQIYRRAPGESVLTERVRAIGPEYIDTTAPLDGHYFYTVASVRSHNGQESLSAQTPEVEVVASATAPGAPENLSLQLTGQGIVANWQPPVSGNVASYNLYRASAAPITSISGLTPLRTGLHDTITVDPRPSTTQHSYVVTALDAAGNESPISNSAYLNATLLPVASLQVESIDGSLPVLSWTASGGVIDGYHVYIGPESSPIRMTTTPTSALSYTDTGYNGGERRYTVSTVDAAAVEMARSIVLPELSAEIVSGLPIQRGLMNRLQVQVANTSGATVTNVSAIIRVANIDHRSLPFSLAANETRLVPVVIGGYDTLPGLAAAQLRLEMVPNEDELVRLTSNTSLPVIDGSLVVGMETEQFTRGGVGKVRLTIENTTDVDIELLTARQNGNADSNELRFKLLDADGNVLATRAYRQALGAGVVTLANGLTVARIPAGSSYVSDVFELNVPAASPDQVKVRLEVDKVRYHSGQVDEVIIPGHGSEKTVVLVDTAYYGQVVSVTPASSFGDEDILIDGRAVDRASTAPLPNAVLSLVLNQQGFERKYTVTTDATGNFRYVFKPTLTDAGEFKVSVVHPDVSDRTAEGSFTINRVSLTPSPYKLSVPRNYAFSIPFVAKAGTGSSATNLQLVIDPAAQPGGSLPAGVTLGLPAPVSISAKQSLNLPVVFTAGNVAPQTGSVVIDLYSAEHPGSPLSRATVNYTLVAAMPHLTANPGYVEAGLAVGGNAVESVVFGNDGLQDALDLQFSLVNTDGSAAPSWVSIVSAANGTLAVGGQRSIDISFAPPTSLADGVYEFRLKVVGTNVPAQTIGVFASVTESGIGNALFKVSDIYTATLGENGQIIQGLAGATIQVQNEDVISISASAVTDSLGEAQFNNLPAGNYTFRARATSHQELGGRFRIKPGLTVNQPVFLNYNLVTVEWSVREVSILDRYDIIINATYETQVPAAVLVQEPTVINLPPMAAGDVYYGELTLTNYGLIRADNVKQTFPADDGNFRYEYLVEVPDTLAAKERVTVPFRIIAVRSLEEDGASSGAGCFSYLDEIRSTCSYTCINGQVGNNETYTRVSYVTRTTCSTSSTGGTGGTGGGSGGVGGTGGTGGSLSTSGPSYSTLGGTQGCVPGCRGECCKNNDGAE